MGLSVVVGISAKDMDEQVGYLQEIRECFTSIRESLDRAGVGHWCDCGLSEQEVFEDGLWFGGLQALRRLAVHLAQTGLLPVPLTGARTAVNDPLLRKAYTEFPANPPGPFDHLIYHSDWDGFYVPVDFAQVIVDENVDGYFLGSSVRLLEETRRVAGILGLPEDLDPYSEEVIEACFADAPAARGWQRYGIESHTCLQLISAAEHSVRTGAAIGFC